MIVILYNNTMWFLPQNTIHPSPIYFITYRTYSLSEAHKIMIIWNGTSNNKRRVKEIPNNIKQQKTIYFYGLSLSLSLFYIAWVNEKGRV